MAKIIIILLKLVLFDGILQCNHLKVNYDL